MKNIIFNKKIKNAESLVEDKYKLSKFIIKVTEYLKSSKISKSVKSNISDINNSIELLQSWILGKYTDIPKKSIISIVASLLYLVMPLDIIPDFIINFGFLDDLTVFGVVFSSVRSDLDKFLVYKNKMDNLSSEEDRSVGALVGLACGDALGTTLEFCPSNDGIIHDQMIGKGHFNLKAGQWTDDTSMALCLAASLEDDGFNLKKQLDNYLKWFMYGYQSSTGKCFDIGVATHMAITFYNKSGEIKHSPEAKGNGSIMRLSPVVIYMNKENFFTSSKFSALSSVTTHNSQEAVECCMYLGAIIYNALKYGKDKTKDEILFSEDIKKLDIKEEKVISLINGDWLSLKYDDLPNTGYVIDTMISALHCFYYNNTFKSSLVSVVNLAGDSDTMGAVCGQIAGAYYGYKSMPKDWVSKIYNLRYIQDLAVSLHDKDFCPEDYENIENKYKKIVL